MTNENGSGRKEALMIVGALALATAGVIGAYWMDAREDAAVAAEIEVVRASAPAPAAPDALHDDIYFDFKSVRLRADAVKTLQERATVLKEGGTWVVLVQGHADAAGPAEYNRRLAERRAETVRTFLVELGVPETSVKVVTIGQEGALCDEPTKECQSLNRRVHLEMRRLAPRASTPADEPVQAVQAR